MAYDIGTARGVIEMEYNGRGVTQAQRDLQGLEKHGGNARESIGKVSRTAGIAGLAIAAGLGLAVNAAANFEQRMSAVEAVSGATAGEMQDLSDKALQLGKDTAFSATEAASAIEELVKAGISVEDVLNGAADAVVNLAAAGEISMPEAATIASNAMNQFGLKAKDMVSVADNIAGAANASAIDVSDFGQSLSQVGAVANLAGATFADTATAIALMGNAGIKGSDAGTSLKSMLSNLQPTTVKQIDLFDQLGLAVGESGNAFYDAQGNLKSLGSVADTLQGAMEGLTKQQQQQALETLFGSDAIRAAAILADNGAEGFNHMAKAMGKVSAADVAAKRMDNLNGKMEALKGSLETAGITIGNSLIPYVTMLVEKLTDAANWFLNLDADVQKAVAGFAAGSAGMLLLVAALGKVIIFTGDLLRALKLLRLAFAVTWVSALGPIALVIVAIAAIAGALFLLYKHNARFRDMVQKAWGQIQEAVAAVVDFFVGEVWPEIKSVIDMLIDAWDELANGTGGALEEIRAAASVFLDLMLSQWQNVWNLISGVVQAVWVMIKGYILGSLEIIKGLINVVMGIISGDWGRAWDGIKQILHGAWTIIVALVKGWGMMMIAIIKFAWNTIKNFITAAVKVIWQVIKAAWQAIKAVTSAVWNAIKAMIVGQWNAIKAVVRGAASAVVGLLKAAWERAKSATVAVWEGIKSAVRNAVHTLMSIVSGIKDKITGFFDGAIGWLEDAGKAIIQGLINGLDAMLGPLDEMAGKVAGTISKVLPHSPVKEGPLKVLNHGYAGKKIVEMVIGGMLDMEQPLHRALGTLMPSMPGGIAVPGVGVGGSVRSRGGKGAASGLRLLDGTLTLDADGRAFITGVAYDAAAAVGADNQRWGRMNNG